MPLVPVTPADVEMLKIAEIMVRDGKSIIEASRQVLGPGKEIVEATFKSWARGALTGSKLSPTQVSQITNGLKHVKDGESVLTTLARWVRGGSGGATAAAEGGVVSSTLSSIGSVFGLSGTAAVLAGAAVVTVVLGGATYAGSRFLGGRAADAPIVAGPNSLGEHTRNVVDPPYIQGVENDAFGVFVGGGYNEVIVGQLSVIMETPTCSLIGWGTDCNKKVKDSGATFRMVAGPFKGPFDARQAFDKLKVPNSERIKPLASGTCAKFTFDGKEHDIDNAFRLLR